MTRAAKARRLLPATFGFAVLLGGCVSGVPVSISNHSAAPLTHVTVSGKGFSEPMDPVAPGATETVSVRPRTATPVRVAFEAAGQRYSATTENDIENDTVNTIVVTVAQDMSVTMETPLR